MNSPLIIDNRESLDRLNQTLQFMAQQNLRRRAQNLDESKARLGAGINSPDEVLAPQTDKGLLSTLKGLFSSEPPKAWEAKGAFTDLNQQKKESPLLSTQQEILKELQDQVYAGDKEGYNRNVQGLAAQLTNRDIQDKGISSISAKADQGMWNSAGKQFVDNLKSIRDNETAVNNYNKITEYNRNLKPIYAEKYTGNEVDQQQQLMNDTIRAIQNGGGLAAYIRYLTTGKAISDHYGHNFQPLPVDYFGIKGTGKGSTESFIVKGTDGNDYTVQIPKGSVFTDNLPAVNKQIAILSGTFNRKDVTPIQFAGGNAQPKGDVGGDTGKISADLQEQNFKNDMMFKAQALQAWNDADVPGKVDYFNKGERSRIANSNLPADNPYRIDENGNLTRVKNNLSNVANTEKPEENKSKKSLWR